MEQEEVDEFDDSGIGSGTKKNKEVEEVEGEIYKRKLMAGLEKAF